MISDALVNVRITRFLDGAREATGHAVIVDVFRAFTTAAFCIAAGAREIVLVAEGRPIAGFQWATRHRRSNTSTSPGVASSSARAPAHRA